MLDCLAGIDAWHVIDGAGMRGVASRVQWCLKSWRTFTIRYALASGHDTEWQKRSAALEDGTLLYPEWTVQAYVSQDRSTLLDAALIRTANLYSFASARLHGREKGVWLNTNPQDGNVFVCVSWDAIGLTSFADMGLVDHGQMALDGAHP